MLPGKDTFMKEVTQILNEYRECVRNLWNMYFLKQLSSGKEWDIFDEYDDVCGKIFSSLVLSSFNKDSGKKSSAYAKTPEPLSCLRVEPIVESGIPIIASREKGSFTYWDYPVSIIKSSEADMRFIDFFDFNLLEFREFQYCRVRIFSSNVYPDLVGHDALLFCNHVKIMFDKNV